MGRLDHTFNAKTSIFGRYNFDDAKIVSPLDNVGGVVDDKAAEHGGSAAEGVI